MVELLSTVYHRYIGYSNVVSLNGNVTLAWGACNNLLGVTISTPGKYEFDAQILSAYTVASDADNVLCCIVVTIDDGYQLLVCTVYRGELI